MDDKKRKILVTGASGFVGRALVEELQNHEKYEVYGLIGRQRKDSLNNPARPKFFQVDVSSEETLKPSEELQNTEIVIHTAGLAHQFGPLKKEDFWRVNVNGTENICRMAQEIGARRFVLISSVAVYGDYGKTSIDETFPCRPDGFYAESKLESEKRAIEYCERNNIGLTILRLATVIGEADRGNTARLITTIDKGRFFWVGKGTNKKSLIYKTDAAKGILKALERIGTGGVEIYNLTAAPVSVSEIVGAISKALGKKTPRLKIPESWPRAFFRLNEKSFSVGALKKIEKTFEKWLSDDIFSGKRFYEKFGFEPGTPISEALERQVNFYLRQKKV